MKPVLFSIFKINIYGYGTMIAIGIISAIFLLQYRAKKANIDTEKILDMSIIGVIFGIIGGKLFYVLTDLKNIIADPMGFFKNIGGGFVVYGSIIGGALGVMLYCKKHGWKVLQIFDLAIPTVAIAQGFGRIGCVLAGCCYGKPTDSVFGIIFNNSHFAPAGVKLIPTQVYSSIFDFLLGFFLLWYSKKNKKDGRIFALYVIIYSVGRFFVEYLRGDLERGFVGILSTSQFISIFTIIIGIIIFFKDSLFNGRKNVE